MSIDDGCLFVKTDIGKESAGKCASYVLNHYKNVTHVISAGIAGALSPELKTKDIVVSRNIIDYPADMAYDSTGYGRMQPTGTILCSDDIVNNRELKEKLFAKYGALCVEMESTGIIRECIRLDVPFTAVKVISDYADGKALNAIIKNQYDVTDVLGIYLAENVKEIA